jgi:protein ImuA
MIGLRKAHALAALKARIARLENRPVLAGGAALVPGKTTALLAAPPGLLHEVFTDERRNAGASLGFALGQTRALLSPTRPALLVLQLRKDAQDMGLPYGSGLKSFGIDPAAVILGRLENITELLWALEEAVCCRAVAAVIADIAGSPKTLDFTASRRLSLRAAGAGTSIFFLRYGRDREASAAQLRWRLTPELSAETMFDARAPSGPRFLVALEKGRLVAAAKTAGAGEDFLLDWTKNGFVVVDESAKSASSRLAGTAPHGAVPAALGDRLSQAG